MVEMKPAYRRVLLKLSGEALAGEAGNGLDFRVMSDVCGVIARCVQMGVQVGIVRQMIYGYTVDKNIGFAIVDIKHAAPGTVLELGSNRAKATVCDKTFIK